MFQLLTLNLNDRLLAVVDVTVVSSPHTRGAIDWNVEVECRSKYFQKSKAYSWNWTVDLMAISQALQQSNSRTYFNTERSELFFVHIFILINYLLYVA